VEARGAPSHLGERRRVSAPPELLPASGSFLDTSAPSDPLVLYRLLGNGDREAGNALRVARTPNGIQVGY